MSASEWEGMEESGRAEEAKTCYEVQMKAGGDEAIQICLPVSQQQRNRKARLTEERKQLCCPESITAQGQDFMRFISNLNSYFNQIS